MLNCFFTLFWAGDRGFTMFYWQGISSWVMGSALLKGFVGNGCSL